MDIKPAKSNGKKILIVDDNLVIQRTVTRVLKDGGYAVFTAGSGSAMLAVINQERPDLILLDLVFDPQPSDIGMGLQDGFQILEWLRRMGGAAKIPIIIISSTDPAEFQERIQASGVTACFRKPLDRAKLVEVINACLLNPSPAPSQPAAG